MPAIKEISVSEGQNLWDVALQEYGSVEGVFEILNLNNDLTGLNDRLNQNQKIRIDNDKIINESVVKYYAKVKEGYNPATGDEPTDAQFSDDFSDDFLI